MRINELPEEGDERHFLPKIMRNDSGSSGIKKPSPFAMPEDAEIFRMKEK